ncbi:MAG TPA: GNAT family N-acetyltransferase [Anaerolineae bacterium]
MILENNVATVIPQLAGFVFRKFAGADDYAAMVDVINAARVADSIEEQVTIDVIANDFEHLSNTDPQKDILMIDADGRLVGFGLVRWWQNDVGEWVYGMNADVHPQWRGMGIGRRLLEWQETRLREIAATHPATGLKYLQVFCMERAQMRLALLKHAGYEVIRYGFMMVRPDLADVPDEWPLPDGLETRPVLPEHRRAIWEAMDEAFRDHWGHRAGTEEDYQGFINWPEAQPELWQVAWDTRTNEVAGMVLNTVFANENEKYGIKRGWTDPIFVRRPWRRQGLARALIMRSLKVLRDAGMTEAALGVDAQNPNKALHLYESCGYRQYQRSFTMRKPLERLETGE